MTEGSDSTHIVRMTPETCRLWLEEKTFRLQPEIYQAANPNWPGAVGLEIEMLPLFLRGKNRPDTVPLQGERDSLAAWLRDLARERGWTTKTAHEHGQDLLMNVLLDRSDNLSFEPGGQLEFSSRPYECLSQATKRTVEIQKILDQELAKRGNVTITQVGLNPWHSVDEIGLQMQKPRYIAMNGFFSGISPYGPRMMRQTCTVQVNLDFGRDQTTMAKRYLASMLLAPFSGAVFNYSAFSSQVPVGMTGLRSKVWRHMDPSRTGVQSLKHLSRSLTKAACVETYYEFLMNARVVFVTGLNYRVMNQPVTWAQWVKNGIDGVWPNSDDFDTHLSLLFPEVRARGFLELRSVDCQARAWQFVPAAWWTGLLYDDKACDQVIEMLLPFESRMTELLDAAPQGLEHPVLREYAQRLITLAAEGFGRLPNCYFEQNTLQTLQAYAQHFTLKGRVPSQDLLDEFHRQGKDKLTFECFERVDNYWQELAGASVAPKRTIL